MYSISLTWHPLQDTRLMKTAGTISISVALRSFVVAVLGLVFMFLTSVLLTLLTIAILPVLLAALRVYSTLNKKYTREGLAASAEASTVAEEVFGSIRTVRYSHLGCLLQIKDKIQAKAGVKSTVNSAASK